MQLKRLNRKTIRPLYFYCLKHQITIILFILSFIIGCLFRINLEKKEVIKCDPIKIETNLPVPVPTVTKTPTQNKQWTGKVSYYSKDGCIGCNELQITASGDVFDEDANTLAFNWLPLNTEVVVTNLDVGISVVAKVNDRHGAYNEKHHWRIADLSKNLCQKLQCKTDVTSIKIEKI